MVVYCEMQSTVEPIPFLNVSENVPPQSLTNFLETIRNSTSYNTDVSLDIASDVNLIKKLIPAGWVIIILFFLRTLYFLFLTHQKWSKKRQEVNEVRQITQLSDVTDSNV